MDEFYNRQYVLHDGQHRLIAILSCFVFFLEWMTDLIVKQNEDKLAPIKDKTKTKKIRAELRRVLDAHREDISRCSVESNQSMGAERTFLFLI